MTTDRSGTKTNNDGGRPESVSLPAETAAMTAQSSLRDEAIGRCVEHGSKYGGVSGIFIWSHGESKDSLIAYRTTKEHPDNSMEVNTRLLDVQGKSYLAQSTLETATRFRNPDLFEVTTDKRTGEDSLRKLDSKRDKKEYDAVMSQFKKVSSEFSELPACEVVMKQLDKKK